MASDRQVKGRTVYRVKCCVLAAGTKTKNGTIYPREILEREFKYADSGHLYVVSELNDFGESIIALDKIVGYITGGFVDEQGRAWVEADFPDTLKPLKGLEAKDAILLLSQFYLGAVGKGTIGPDGTVGDDYRLNAFVTTDTASVEEATKMAVILVRDE
jgi:hypothetical protein